MLGGIIEIGAIFLSWRSMQGSFPDDGRIELNGMLIGGSHRMRVP
jgi:hypothetical protein